MHGAHVLDSDLLAVDRVMKPTLGLTRILSHLRNYAEGGASKVPSSDNFSRRAAFPFTHGRTY